MTPGDNRRPADSLTYGSSVPTLPDSLYLLLRDLIVERTGVLFDEPKRTLLADKLSGLVTSNGLTSLLDYYYLLRYDDPTGAHLSELMDRLAVPETFFWRQSEQLQAIADIVAPAHFAKHPERPLKIWSAACCTGEEPISVAIALAEAGQLQPGAVEIVATDGSPAMVERARRGEYGERSFRQLPERLRERYFERVDNRWRPLEQLRRTVRWDIANLARPADVQRFAAADVILCRNVFIYFADDAIRDVVRLFNNAMPPDAYLFLGAAESLTRLGVDLQLAEIGSAFAYVKARPRPPVERKSATAASASAAVDVAGPSHEWRA
jgi:chemotaxis protein methyltransferase CheR